jgi:excisionase family DNA binding protein
MDSEVGMAQKFLTLDEAAEQLGVTKERLSQLREAGKVRAYRDGASWKFRGDDVDRLSSEGIPTLDPPSDIDLGSSLSLDLDRDDARSAGGSGLELDLGEDELVTGPASDFNLDDIEEPTVQAMGADDAEEVLGASDDDQLLDLSDSILLSEKNLGPAGRPPSTIIGKAELDPDGDLDLTLRGDDSTAMSDVKLAKSDILIGTDDDSLDLEPPNPSDHFQNLAELDVDLESESSRVLTPGPKKGKGASKAQAPPSSELELAASDSNVVGTQSDIGLSGSGGASGGLTGLSALGLDDDDQVLGEGSDVTLSAASSGINIISPSDSGLSLDEVALSSASVSSPLDLGDDVGLEPLELSEDALEGDEPFQLTPLSETDDEEKDSSQVIALEDIGEDEGVVFHAEEREAVASGDDFSPAGLAAGGAVAMAPVEDMAMSGWTFGLLTCGMLLLLVCGMMMFDLVRNIWSWDGMSPLNGTLIEVVNPLL